MSRPKQSFIKCCFAITISAITLFTTVLLFMKFGELIGDGTFDKEYEEDESMLTIYGVAAIMIGLMLSYRVWKAIMNGSFRTDFPPVHEIVFQTWLVGLVLWAVVGVVIDRVCTAIFPNDWSIAVSYMLGCAAAAGLYYPMKAWQNQRMGKT